MSRPFAPLTTCCPIPFFSFYSTTASFWQASIFIRRRDTDESSLPPFSEQECKQKMKVKAFVTRRRRRFNLIGRISFSGSARLPPRVQSPRIKPLSEKSRGHLQYYLLKKKNHRGCRARLCFDSIKLPERVSFPSEHVNKTFARVEVCD